MCDVCWKVRSLSGRAPGGSRGGEIQLLLKAGSSLHHCTVWIFPWTFRAGSFQWGLYPLYFLRVRNPPGAGAVRRALLFTTTSQRAWFVLTASFPSSVERSVIASSHKLLPALPFYHLQPFSCDTGPINLVRTISPHWVLAASPGSSTFCIISSASSDSEWLSQTERGLWWGLIKLWAGGQGGSWRWMGFGTQG